MIFIFSTCYYLIKISIDDKMSLGNGNKLTWTITLLYIKKCESSYKKLLREKQNTANRIWDYTITSTAWKDRCQRTKKKQLNMAKHDWIFFPVSNRENTMEGDGGSHFSLAILSKKEHRFFSLWPIKRVKEKKIVGSNDQLIGQWCVTSGTNLYKLPEFKEVHCVKHKNGFDCRPFIIGYMKEAI